MAGGEQWERALLSQLTTRNTLQDGYFREVLSVHGQTVDEPARRAREAMSGLSEGTPPDFRRDSDSQPPGGESQEPEPQLVLDGTCTYLPRPATPGYLRLVAEQPSPRADWLPAWAEPSLLEAAQRRLAFATICMYPEDLEPSLSTGSELFVEVDDVDVAAQVGSRVRGTDHFTEREKQALHGMPAAAARAQLTYGAGAEALVSVEVTGNLVQGCDGKYMLSGEFEGWPHFTSDAGYHLYRHCRSESWRFGPTFSPEQDSCTAFVSDASGPLPIGKVDTAGDGNGWMCYMRGEWVPCPELSLDLLFTAAKRPAADQSLARQQAVARDQLDDALGLIVCGCPQQLDKMNGVYLEVDGSEPDGWLHLRNENMYHLFRYQMTQSWRIGPSFSPDRDSSNAYIVAETGKLPLGESMWACYTDGQWTDCRLTMTAVSDGEAEVERVKQARTAAVQQRKDADQQAVTARRQLHEVVSISVSGWSRRDRPNVNGSYVPWVEHNGWPVLRNAHGVHLYRFQSTQTWRIGQEFSPEVDSCSAHLECSTGELPIGLHQWVCFIKAHGENLLVSYDWEPRELELRTILTPTPESEEAKTALALTTLDERQTAWAQLLPESAAHGGERCPVVLTLSGCHHMYNGEYMLAGIWNGWPHFKNSRGSRLFRFVKNGAQESWRIGPGFAPDADFSFAFVVSQSGEVPLGEVNWTCYEHQVWRARTLHVALTRMQDHKQSQENWLELEAKGASLTRLLGIKK